MRIYLEKKGRAYGPYSRETILLWLESGRAKPSDLGCLLGSQNWIPLYEILEIQNLPNTEYHASSTTNSILNENNTKSLREHIFSPIKEFFNFSWISDWKFVSIILLGIFPLMSTNVLLNEDDSQYKYWALALYFSVIWAFFFNGLVKPEDATAKGSLICFFGTGIVSIPIMLGFYEIQFFSDMAQKASSEDFIDQFIGMFFGVAILEESCKFAVLIVFWKWISKGVISIRTFMYYGLMSGLGFGIYEGVMYQSERNLAIFDYVDIGNSGASSEALKAKVLDIYVANIWRLTTLPFLHAVWCAITGLFFGLSTKYGFKLRLIFCGLVISSALHAAHNSTGDTLGGWGIVLIDIISIICLLVYWRDQTEIEKSLS